MIIHDAIRFFLKPTRSSALSLWKQNFINFLFNDSIDTHINLNVISFYSKKKKAELLKSIVLLRAANFRQSVTTDHPLTHFFIVNTNTKSEMKMYWIISSKNEN